MIFSSLTEPKFPNAAIGIESDSMTAVALSGGRRSYSVKQAATIPISPGVLVPSFTDINIVNRPAFADALREVTESAGLLKQKRWSVTLPSSTARTAILSLDSEPASKQEADEVLDWKAEQSFGTSAAELRLARQKIELDKDGRTRYFVTAVKLAVIDEYETQFEDLGWSAGLILPRTVGEANWLIDRKDDSDSLLISGTDDGFMALLLRGDEPAVVRSITCGPTEIEDEIYRLVMFYNDRFAGTSGGALSRLLVIGDKLIPATVQTIASEALGSDIRVLSADDVGLNLLSTGLNFNDLAAPAGLASLGA